MGAPGLRQRSGLGGKIRTRIDPFQGDRDLFEFPGWHNALPVIGFIGRKSTSL